MTMGSRRVFRRGVGWSMWRLARGFTLPELLIAIMVAGLLAALALPNFAGLATRAKLVQAKQGMRKMLMEAYATVHFQEVAAEQLLAQALDGMEQGSTMAEASDGQFSYLGSLPQEKLYVVAAEAIGDASLAGKYLVGCIDLDGGLIMIQRDYESPSVGCGGLSASAIRLAKQKRGRGRGAGGASPVTSAI